MGIKKMTQVTLEIYNASQDDLQCKRLSRTLALMCYFLNTRLDNTNKFVHGGVFGRQFNNTYNPNKDQTRFEVVVNQKHVINNAHYLDDDKYSDEDFRGFSQHFIQTLSGLSPEFSTFSSYKFLNCQPIVVGQYYMKESGIDGRTLNQNYGNYNQGTISTVYANQGHNISTIVQQQPIQSTNFNSYQNVQHQGNFNQQVVQAPGQIVNMQGSQYLQQGSNNVSINNPVVNRQISSTIQAPTNVSLNRNLSSTVQAPTNTSFNRGNSSLSGSVGVNNNLSGRKTVVNLGTSFNNDSQNKSKKRMSSIL